MPVSREKLFLGHSLTSTKFPKRVALKDLAKVKEEDRKVDLASLGLWEVSSPDFNKYYPDVDEEDLNPKDSEFFYPLFRALSKIVINKWGPIDFSAKDVLKSSMKKLVGQTVFTNHEAIVGNEVGVVSEVSWENARTQDGIKIPGGINARFKLDGKSNPKLVRSMNSDPPSIHSVSVTVTFKWERSHPELTESEFWNQLGQFDSKGELIRRIVTEILSYEEISLVTHGADPYAQIIKEGKINNPKYADDHYQFSAEEFVENGHYFDWKDYTEGKVSLNAGSTIPSRFNNNDTTTKHEESMDKDLLNFLRTQLGLDATTAEAAVIKAMKDKLPVMVASAGDLTTANASLKIAQDELAALKAKYPDGTVILSKEDKEKLDKYDGLIKDQAVATKATTELRAEALRLYHLSAGGADKADASITKLIAEAGYETLGALHKQYFAAVEKSFTATCDSCGSTKITRASASAATPGVVADTDDKGEGKGGAHKEKTTDEVLASLSAPKNFGMGLVEPTAKK